MQACRYIGHYKNRIFWYFMNIKKKKQVEQLIVETTKFTQDWMSGKEDLEMSNFKDLMINKFIMVMSNGMMLDKNGSVNVIQSMRGKWNVQISVEDIQLTEIAGVIRANYTEIHQAENTQTQTKVTSVFTSEDLSWVSFQATTIQKS